MNPGLTPAPVADLLEEIRWAPLGVCYDYVFARDPALATMDRSAGIDVNVSNVTVASHDTGRDVRISRIAREGGAPERDRSRRRRDRRRQRELDRSRRAMNRAQYQLSKRQQKRAKRREIQGLPPVEVLPMGPRMARADGARILRREKRAPQMEQE